MSRQVFDQIVAMSEQEQAQERSLLYLTQHLGGFLKKGERVLICFHEYKKGNLSWLLEQAVLRCGAVPVVWQMEHKWKGLLRQAFLNKASVILGEPLLVLGLTKLMKNCATPLYIRRVIVAGYPCPQWMIDGIIKGFDCVVGGCFTLGITGVVAGFACGQSWGVHIREEEYGVDIIGENGELAKPGTLGEMMLYPKAAPELRLSIGDRARKLDEPCPCGCPAPRLMDFVLHTAGEADILALSHELLNWTSILDCWISRGAYGLELDIVAFPGEKLPKLPSAAKLNLRYLNLETDEPFTYDPVWMNPSLRY